MNNNMQDIEKLLIKCIETSRLESNKYAKIIGICNNPEFINILRKVHITKLKHCNMLEDIYQKRYNKNLKHKTKEYELIGDFKSNLKLSFNSSIKNIDIYKEMYFLFEEYPSEKNMMFEFILDEQIICTKNSYMISCY